MSNERVGFARRLVLSHGVSLGLHLLGGLTVTWLADRVLAPSAGSDSSGSRVVVVTMASPAPYRQDALTSSSTSEPVPDDVGIRVGEGAASISIPGFIFDYSVIAHRASSLFPFLTGRLALERIVATRSREVNTGLVNPFGRGRRSQNDKPPLALGATDRQALIDKSWSRRDRWPAFRSIAALADASNPDDGDLPTLLKSYVAQNGLQALGGRAGPLDHVVVRPAPEIRLPLRYLLTIFQP